MAHEFVEALVVLDDGAAAGGRLAELRQHAVVLQWLPPRIAIVRVEAKVPSLEAVPGTRWFLAGVPAEVSADFTPAERLFAEAWLSRRQAKTRPGEGLPWDAPGREAPDWPDEPPQQ